MQHARQRRWSIEDERLAIRFLIRDRDAKFPVAFDRVFEGDDVTIISTPYRSPKANAFAKHCIRSVRKECLDHLLILNDRHLQRVLKEYMTYCHHAWSRQGIDQQILAGDTCSVEGDLMRCRDVTSLTRRRGEVPRTFPGAVMSEYSNHHATIFVASEVAESIEVVRRAWDPIMAGQIAAHVTLVYPQEAPIVDLLIERVRVASTDAAPFRLRLGRVACFGRPEDGIYVEVEDIDGGYRQLREDVLRLPFHPVEFPPHVTLIHPRTSPRGRAFWETPRDQQLDQEFTAAEVAITAFNGTKWVVVETFPLRRGG